jgi:hypothetical protein
MEILTMLLRDLFRIARRALLKPIGHWAETAAMHIRSAANCAGRWLWRLARRRPLLFLLLLASAFYWGSRLLRGEGKTHRDLMHLVRRMKQALTIAPSLNESLSRVESGRAPFRQTVLRYPARFIDLASRAHRDHENFLKSLEALERAWRAIGGDQKLTIQLIVLPAVEPYTGGHAAASWHPPLAVDQSTFEEMAPILKEICTLIVEGDGSGKGRLPISGYEVEPVTDPASQTCAAQEVK